MVCFSTGQVETKQLRGSMKALDTKNQRVIWVDLGWWSGILGYLTIPFKGYSRNPNHRAPNQIINCSLKKTRGQGSLNDVFGGISPPTKSALFGLVV